MVTNGASRPRAAISAGSSCRTTSGISPSRVEGEIVVQKLVARDADLRGRPPAPRRVHEEMHVRRALPVPPEAVQQLLRRPVGWAAVAGRQDGAEAVVSVPVRFDAAAQVPRALRRVEERVAAACVDVPHVHHHAGDGRAVRVADLAVQPGRPGEQPLRLGAVDDRSARACVLPMPFQPFRRSSRVPGAARLLARGPASHWLVRPELAAPAACQANPIILGLPTARCWPVKLSIPLDESTRNVVTWSLRRLQANRNAPHGDNATWFG